MFRYRSTSNLFQLRFKSYSHTFSSTTSKSVPFVFFTSICQTKISFSNRQSCQIHFFRLLKGGWVGGVGGWISCHNEDAAFYCSIQDRSPLSLCRRVSCKTEEQAICVSLVINYEMSNLLGTPKQYVRHHIFNMADNVYRDRNIVSFLCTRVIKGKIIFFSNTCPISRQHCHLSIC